MFWKKKTISENSQSFANRITNISEYPSLPMLARRALIYLSKELNETPTIENLQENASVDKNISQLIDLMEKYIKEGKVEIVYTFIDILEKVVRKRAKGENIDKKEMDVEISIVEVEAKLMDHMLKLFEIEGKMKGIETELNSLVQDTDEYIMRQRQYDKEQRAYDNVQNLIIALNKQIDINKNIFESLYGADAISLADFEEISQIEMIHKAQVDSFDDMLEVEEYRKNN